MWRETLGREKTVKQGLYLLSFSTAVWWNPVNTDSSLLALGMRVARDWPSSWGLWSQWVLGESGLRPAPRWMGAEPTLREVAGSPGHAGSRSACSPHPGSMGPTQSTLANTVLGISSFGFFSLKCVVGFKTQSVLEQISSVILDGTAQDLVFLQA